MGVNSRSQTGALHALTTVCAVALAVALSGCTLAERLGIELPWEKTREPENAQEATPTQAQTQGQAGDANADPDAGARPDANPGANAGAETEPEPSAEAEPEPGPEPEPGTQQETQPQQDTASSAGAFNLESVPAYTGSPSVVVNSNVPFFTTEDLARQSFEDYSPLDGLGRCGAAFACIGPETMPAEDEERGEIGSVHPTGWNLDKYDWVDGRFLYNRCHLIAWSLAGENANPQNLITGTRSMNTQGMLPFEEQVARCVWRTGNHVLYRVTPIFEGNNLVASGVLLEAQSVEDGGSALQFCVYCYNAEPGVAIDYATGASHDAGTHQEEPAPEGVLDASQYAYILNTNPNAEVHRFHLPSCEAVRDMAEHNKQGSNATREELIEQGYVPCRLCNP